MDDGKLLTVNEIINHQDKSNSISITLIASEKSRNLVFVMNILKMMVKLYLERQ